MQSISNPLYLSINLIIVRIQKSNRYWNKKQEISEEEPQSVLYTPSTKSSTRANQDKDNCRKVWKRKPTKQKEKINGLAL